ncbi:ExbD/TolR family protein [Alysiella filiformis]|uniref:Outer membrane transport energization protein ExbD (TC 2.C.1.1.1) n=1 Tax=Alysiella filiformis DSM 16848 TaxID=1120981 RepID=A0A286EDB4_9NEIS|nr:biopolymer transporter ExbD [Alysiella filiformis]QMT31162.1 biopolymer transporter ExbD [Alysiella filiformis]UBQ55844.1 biopolymer transporter ExbD [Alysiella filiformis DSM 16848]SOD68849.1 outer membrane transport energization protein ExbD (TC 2.C.1.1.1) [Alysiella filiformis DSM 16848]
MAFGSMGDGDEDAPMSDINVTPLVDVMLVLLIVFMITMPVLTHSLPLELPTTSSKTEQAKVDVKPLEIAIDEKGQYAIGSDSNAKVDLAAIKSQFSQIAQKDPNTVVAIDADKDVAYDHVVKVLEAAREAGLSKIGFRMKVENGTP